MKVFVFLLTVLVEISCWRWQNDMTVQNQVRVKIRAMNFKKMKNILGLTKDVGVVSSRKECGTKCINDPSCYGFSFERKPINGKHICYVSNSLFGWLDVEWVTDGRFDYFQVPNTCMRNIGVCENQTCISDGDLRNYECRVYDKNSSCLSLKHNFGVTSGEHFIFPWKNASKIRTMCRDGFTMIANANAHQDGIRNFHFTKRSKFKPGISILENTMFTNSFLQETMTSLNFKQLWFVCYKPETSRTLSIITTNDTFGVSVIKALMGNNHTCPSCGGYTPTLEDNSMLGRNCHWWIDKKWGMVGYPFSSTHLFYMYGHQWFLDQVKKEYHCDDMSTTDIKAGSYWKIYVK